MTEPRFRPLTNEDMSADQRRVAQALADGPRGGVRGPFHALLRSPELADRVRRLGDYVRFESALDPVLRELVILLVARFWSAHYEWYAHRKAAIELGMSPAIPDAIAQGLRPPALSPDEALVYELCTQLLADKDVTDGTYRAAVDRFGEAAILEMVATAGYYGFVSLILNVNRQAAPDGSLLPPLRP
jgi:4-carboxymuconolactone decarboxylase